MSADRITEIRRDLAEAKGPHPALDAIAFLLAEYDALTAEVKRYRDAFAGWTKRVRPECCGTCTDVFDPRGRIAEDYQLHDLVAAVLPERES